MFAETLQFLRAKPILPKRLGKVILKRGGQLCWAEYGEIEKGKVKHTIFYFHGAPGCRFEPMMHSNLSHDKDMLGGMEFNKGLHRDGSNDINNDINEAINNDTGFIDRKHKINTENNLLKELDMEKIVERSLRMDDSDTTDVYSRRGIRLICVERPGFGDSSYQENRTVADYIDDVIELTNSKEMDLLRDYSDTKYDENYSLNSCENVPRITMKENGDKMIPNILSQNDQEIGKSNNCGGNDSLNKDYKHISSSSSISNCSDNDEMDATSCNESNNSSSNNDNKRDDNEKNTARNNSNNDNNEINSNNCDNENKIYVIGYSAGAPYALAMRYLFEKNQMRYYDDTDDDLLYRDKDNGKNEGKNKDKFFIRNQDEKRNKNKEAVNHIKEINNLVYDDNNDNTDNNKNDRHTQNRKPIRIIAVCAVAGSVSAAENKLYQKSLEGKILNSFFSLPVQVQSFFYSAGIYSVVISLQGTILCLSLANKIVNFASPRMNEITDKARYDENVKNININNDRDDQTDYHTKNLKKYEINIQRKNKIENENNDSHSKDNNFINNQGNEKYNKTMINNGMYISTIISKISAIERAISISARTYGGKAMVVDTLAAQWAGRPWGFDMNSTSTSTSSTTSTDLDVTLKKSNWKKSKTFTEKGVTDNDNDNYDDTTTTITTNESSENYDNDNNHSMKLNKNIKKLTRNTILPPLLLYYSKEDYTVPSEMGIYLSERTLGVGTEPVWLSGGHSCFILHLDRILDDLIKIK